MGSIQYEGRLKIISDNYSFVVLTVLRTSFIAKNELCRKRSLILWPFSPKTLLEIYLCRLLKPLQSLCIVKSNEYTCELQVKLYLGNHGFFKRSTSGTEGKNSVVLSCVV